MMFSDTGKRRQELICEIFTSHAAPYAQWTSSGMTSASIRPCKALGQRHQWCHASRMDSSAVERLVYTELVGSSNPSPCTTFGFPSGGLPGFLSSHARPSAFLRPARLFIALTLWAAQQARLNRQLRQQDLYALVSDPGLPSVNPYQARQGEAARQLTALVHASLFQLNDQGHIAPI